MKDTFTEDGVDLDLTDVSLGSDSAIGPALAGNWLTRATRSPRAGGPVSGAPVGLSLLGVKPGGGAHLCWAVVPSVDASGIPATVSFCS